MKKRLLALLLTAVMLLSLSATALAAEARETDFFDDLWHADVNFEDMEYVPVDTEAALAAMDATRALVEDEANKDAVLEGFKAACTLSINARTMYTLASIRYSQDYASEENFTNMNESQQAAIIVGDALYGLARDILNSPCAAALDGIVTEEDAEYLRDYENMTDEELAMQEEITALENEYLLVIAVRTKDCKYSLIEISIACQIDNIVDAAIKQEYIVCTCRTCIVSCNKLAYGSLRL